MFTSRPQPFEEFTSLCKITGQEDKNELKNKKIYAPVLIVGISCIISFFGTLVPLVYPNYVTLQITPVPSTLVLRSFRFTVSLWRVTSDSTAFFPNVPYLDPKQIQHYALALKKATDESSIHYFVSFICSLEGILLHIIGIGCDTATLILTLSQILAASLVASAMINLISLFLVAIFWWQRRSMRTRSALLFILAFPPILTLMGIIPYFLGFSYRIGTNLRESFTPTDILYWVQPDVKVYYGPGVLIVLATFCWKFLVALLAFFMIEPKLCYDSPRSIEADRERKEIQGLLSDMLWV